MKFLDDLLSRAKILNKKIALCEVEDERVVNAADYLSSKGICKVVLTGNEEKIRKQFPNLKLKDVEFWDVKKYVKTEDYINLLYELRKAKGATIEWARNAVNTDMLTFAALGLKSGDLDGIVAGAVLSSAAVSRVAFQIIKAKPGLNSVSSCFVMVPPEGFKGTKEKAIIFSDCGVIPYPTKEQLVDIAFAAKDSAEKIIQTNPRIAMLSFSTKGSAKHPAVELVQEAFEMAKAKDENLVLDGEMQFDAAFVESVGKQKAPNSKVAGHAGGH